MILAHPPNPSLAQQQQQQQDYHRRQRPLFSDFSSSTSTSPTPSYVAPDFSSALESVSLAFDDSNPYLLSRFQNSLAVPFAASPQQHTQQADDEDDSFMNRPGDFYSPNRTLQAGPRSASSQTASQNPGESQQQQQQQRQIYPFGGAQQQHLSAQPRSRFHGQLAGHKRNNSGSTVTSTGPSSPFTPVVQAYPHIHDPEAAAQHYPSPLADGYDPAHQQQAYGKTPSSAQNFTDSFFANFSGPQQQQQAQQPHQTFHHHQSHGDPNLAYQVMMRRTMMSQDSNASANGGIPSLQRLPTSEFERDFRATVESRGAVPKFDRSMSDIYQDELYNPNLSAMTPTSQPQQQHVQIGSHRDVFSERLQAANNGHLSARSNTPAMTLSRDRSPFQPTSEYVHDDIASVQHSPGSRQEAEAAAWAQVGARQRRSMQEPKTISPKDALLELVDPEADSMPSLFPGQQQQQLQQPAEVVQHRFSLPHDPQYSVQHDPQFGGEAPRRASGPMASQLQERPRHHSYQQHVFGPGFPGGSQQWASQESNPEFPAHLTSMESTRSDGMGGNSTPSSSQNSDGSTPATADLPVRRPDHAPAHSGPYACTAPGCAARFDGPGRLHRHRRDAHGIANAQSSPVAAAAANGAAHARSRSQGSPAGGFGSADDQSGGLTGAALAARNSQSGPHTCDRVNPSTGKPCNSIFSRPYDLTRHEETIHNARKLKVRCQFCTEEKTFSRADALTRHMRVVHPEMEVTGKRARRA